ncbi:MAG: HupE/UreJ family protein, partial [Winogradskyella sp.]|nr:HupE/UreJ family protein [Winogradskyella sp.]
FKDWKRVLILVSLFTLGHTLSLILGSFKVVNINAALVEFLIPLTIFIVAIYNVFTAGKFEKSSNKMSLLLLSTLFFGLVHGLGFAREFIMFAGKSDDRWLLLLEFALGIEIAQIIIVFIVLFLGFIGQTVFRFSKRDWIMVISALVAGMVIPMLLGNEYLS